MPCSICSKGELRVALDAALLGGQSERAVAAAFNVNDASVHRHKNKCLKLAISQVSKVRDEAHGEAILTELAYLAVEARRMTAAAESSGDLRAALMGLRELTRILELRAKIFVPPAVVVGKTVTTNYSIQFIAGRAMARPASARELPAIEVSGVEVPESKDTEPKKTEDTTGYD